MEEGYIAAAGRKGSRAATQGAYGILRTAPTASAVFLALELDVSVLGVAVVGARVGREVHAAAPLADTADAVGVSRLLVAQIGERGQAGRAHAPKHRRLQRGRVGGAVADRGMGGLGHHERAA